MKVKSESEVAQSCPTLSDPMDCSLPGSSIHGILQARVLEWGATAFSGIINKPLSITLSKEIILITIFAKVMFTFTVLDKVTFRMSHVMVRWTDSMLYITLRYLSCLSELHWYKMTESNQSQKTNNVGTLAKSLHLSFLICKIGMMIKLNLCCWTVMRIKQSGKSHG